MSFVRFSAIFISFSQSPPDPTSLLPPKSYQPSPPFSRQATSSSSYFLPPNSKPQNCHFPKLKHQTSTLKDASQTELTSRCLSPRKQRYVCARPHPATPNNGMLWWDEFAGGFRWRRMNAIGPKRSQESRSSWYSRPRQGEWIAR